LSPKLATFFLVLFSFLSANFSFFFLSYPRSFASGRPTSFFVEKRNIKKKKEKKRKKRTATFFFFKVKKTATLGKKKENQ
jgi:hypothetical protein